jgi:hypothetical protein
MRLGDTSVETASSIGGGTDKHKNGIIDIKKAKWYEEKLLRLEEVLSNYLNKDVK